jgi:tetratricopeptide (TPR) repeat protein
MAGAGFAGWEAGPRRVGRPTGALLAGALAVVVFTWWAVEEGGAAPTVWYPGALLFLAALALIARPHRLARLPASARWTLTAFAGYTAWSFLSLLWADARGDAWDGANRTLLYLTVLCVFASAEWTVAAATAVLAAFVAAVSGVAIWTLVSAIADGDSAAFADGRLAGPVGYENASAALMFGGFWIALLLAARRESRAPASGLLLAAAGVLLELGILTQSRGSLIGVAAALALALRLAPERRRVGLALAAVAAPAAASLPILLAVYASEPADAAGALDRAGIAIAVSAAALLAAGLASRRIDRGWNVARGSRASLPWIAAGIAVAVAAGGVTAAALSPRVTGGAESGRWDLWRVAAGQFVRRPLLGAGADNFAHDYARLRRHREEPLYPHSVELRALGQTGAVGVTLLAGVLAAASLTARRACRDDLRGPLALAAVAPAAYWLAHASLDWLWELPGVTAPAMACLGLVAGLSATPTNPPPLTIRREPVRPRAALAAGLVIAATVSYALPALAARDVERAARLWDHDRDAARAALDRAHSLNPLSARPALIAGALEVEAGDGRAARRAFERAIARDGRDWYSQTRLAVLDLEQGRRTAALARLDRARTLNPLEPAIAGALDAARRDMPVGVEVGERLARVAVPGPLGRRPLSCRPVLGLAAACSRESNS